MRILSNCNNPFVEDKKADTRQGHGKPSHQQTETPAKYLDTRQAGHSKGVFGILQSLTSGGVGSSQISLVCTQVLTIQ